MTKFYGNSKKIILDHFAYLRANNNFLRNPLLILFSLSTFLQLWKILEKTSLTSMNTRNKGQNQLTQQHFQLLLIMYE